MLDAAVGVLLEARSAALDVVLLFVGLGGAAFCYLLFVGKLIPRALAAVLETLLYGSGTSSS